MKRSIILSCIVSLGLGIVLFQRSHLHHVREEIARKQAEIAAPKELAKEKSRHSQADSPVTEVMNLLTSGSQTLEVGDPREGRLSELATQLTTAELKKVLLEFDESPESQGDLVTYLLSELTGRDPSEAVKLVLELQGRKNNTRFYLDAWSRQEPAASLEWLRSVANCFSRSQQAELFRTVYANLARLEPELAVTNLLGNGVGLDKATDEKIGTNLSGPEGLKSLLTAMNEASSDPANASALAPVREGVIDWMGVLFSRVSFEEMTGVVDECLSANEKIAFAAACDERQLVSDPVQWADWLMTLETPATEDASAEAPPAPIVTRMISWAKENPNAAADWLATMQDGQLKQDSIAAFAEGVRERDPARAAQWAMVLPPSEKRDDIVERIAVELEKKDPSAADSLRQSLPASE